MAKWKITPTKAMRSQVEEASAAGKKFNLMVEFEDEGEQWCITAVEGIPAPGYSEDSQDEKPQAKSPMIASFAQSKDGDSQGY